MHRLIFTFFVILAFAAAISAQPQVDWIRTYHNDNYDHFFDIYPPADGGYIMCGTTYVNRRSRDATGDMWLVRIDDDGRVLWSGTYGGDDYDAGSTVIEVDEGGFLVGGNRTRDRLVYITAWRIDEDGEEIWSEDYGRGSCQAVIELKSGEFLLTGIKYGDGGQRSGFLICIDGDGELFWEHIYDPRALGFFTGMRETQGGVVLGGKISQGGGIYEIVWIVKANIEEQGEIIWERRHQFLGESSKSINTMVSSGDGDFVLVGDYFMRGEDDNHIQDFIAVKVNGEGELTWTRLYDFEWEQSPGYECCYGIDRLDDGGYALVGMLGQARRGAVVRVNSNGVERWRREYGETENENDEGIWIQSFNSVVMGRNHSIVATGFCEQLQDNTRDGLVIKLEPDILEPQFIVYSPEDTVLTVLQGDTITFWVSAHDAQGDEMSYLWIMGEDTLSTDTTETVIFDELGDFEMQCQVSDGEFIVGITWHVRVMAFYIESFTPDTLEMTVRRNSSVDFALEVRALEDVEFNYLWTLIGRGQQRQVGEEESVSVLFDLTGDHRLEGMVWSDEAADVVDWTIHVRSVIWYWWPEENELSLPVDSRQEFAVFPFNPDSDSLSYLWYLNDEQIDVEDTMFVVTVEFSDVGNHSLVSIVHDGCEVDTVTWEIDVYDPNRAASDNLDPLPDCISLFDPRPNPFNSSTTISYQLPEPGEVSIGIYDINGRLVTALVDGRIEAGYHHAVWDGSTVPSGIYFCRMEAVGYSRSVKMVLVR